MATGGVAQLSGGRSSQQGLPRPASWGSPRSFDPGAPSFRSGRKGLTAVLPPPSEFHLRSKVSGSAAVGPARSRGCPRALKHAYRHPTPGLYSHARPRRVHARSELRRVSRHERRTRPRSAGWSPPRGTVAESDGGAHVLHPLSWLSCVTLTPSSTHKDTNNSDPQCHTGTEYT